MQNDVFHSILLYVSVMNTESKEEPMNASNLFDILTSWPIEAATALTPLAGGTNNRAWLVTTAGEVSYVLRLISGELDLPRFRYEAALLAALRNKGLPFQLPLPLQAHNGDVLALVERENAEQTIATLTPFLPGRLPERSAENSARVGVALAQLDAALATIPETSLPANLGTTQFLYGNLYHCHPHVADPFVAAERLLEPEQVKPIQAIFQQSLMDWETLAAQTLPRQLVHRDCGPGNVLMEDGQVTTILDFEFAGVDQRVFDLCVALSWWPVRLMGTGREWELIDAFGHAYIELVPLTESELLALPATLRMRDTTALVYRMGRYLAGLESKKTLQERVQHSLWREKWLDANRETFLQHALAHFNTHKPNDVLP